MFDFRLKVFYTVANRLNFTKAGAELFITQPAVSKHIWEIELQYNVKLFDRNGTKVQLTTAGLILYKHCQTLFSIYKDLDFEMHNLNQQHKGVLKIGASTTIAQYVLPAILASFREKFSDIEISLVIQNSEKIEEALQNQSIDLGIIEGQSKSHSLKYTTFLKDEIVLTTKINNPLNKKGSISIKELANIPLLLREPGSGTLEVIVHALKPFNISVNQLKSEMQLGSTESIKGYLQNSNCFAFLSVYSILNELHHNLLTIVDIPKLSIERDFKFIQHHGATIGLSELFINFTNNHNLK